MLKRIKKLFNKEHTYYIVFDFSDGKNSGTSAIEFKRKNKIKTQKHIKAISEYICKKNSFETVVITWWREIKA